MENRAWSKAQGLNRLQLWYPYLRWRAQQEKKGNHKPAAPSNSAASCQPACAALASVVVIFFVGGYEGPLRFATFSTKPLSQRAEPVRRCVPHRHGAAFAGCRRTTTQGAFFPLVCARNALLRSPAPPPRSASPAPAAGPGRLPGAGRAAGALHFVPVLRVPHPPARDPREVSFSAPIFFCGASSKDFPFCVWFLPGLVPAYLSGWAGFGRFPSQKASPLDEDSSSLRDLVVVVAWLLLKFLPLSPRLVLLVVRKRIYTHSSLFDAIDAQLRSRFVFRSCFRSPQVSSLFIFDRLDWNSFDLRVDFTLGWGMSQAFRSRNPLLI